MTKKIWILWVLIGILLITSAVFYLQKIDSDYKLIYRNSIPDIELMDLMTFDNGTGRASGSISGFVVFKNKTDQPKDMKQYYVIEATDYSDSKSNQLFTYDNILVIEHLSPRSLGKEILSVTGNSGNILTLEDKDGNTFKINKTTKEVNMLDSTGDSTYLMTDEQEFRSFMTEFLTSLR